MAHFLQDVDVISWGERVLKREMWLLCDVELFLEVTFREIPFLCYHSTPTQIPPVSDWKGVLFKSSVTCWTLTVLWFTFTAASVRYFSEMLFNVGPIWNLLIFSCAKREFGVGLNVWILSARHQTAQEFRSSLLMFYLM